MKSPCIFISLFLLLLFIRLNGQDAMFMNGNQSLILLNPSFAGSNGFLRNQHSLRSTERQLASNYLGYSNATDFFIEPLKSGVALSWILEDYSQSTLIKKQFSFTYARHFSFFENDLKIIPSFQVSGNLKSLDVSSLMMGSSIPPGQVVTAFPIRSSRAYISFSTGFLLNYNRDLYVGAYIFNVNQPDDGLLGSSRLPYRLAFYASHTAHFNHKTLLQFTFRVQTQQFSNDVQVGMNLVSFKHLVAGIAIGSPSNIIVNYRPILNLGFRNNILSAVIGYDREFSELAGNSSGLWELHLALYLRRNPLIRELTNFETW